MVYTIPTKRNERAQSTDRVEDPTQRRLRARYVQGFLFLLVYCFGLVFPRRGSVLNVPPKPRGLGARSPHSIFSGLRLIPSHLAWPCRC
jgi:hypothetical protein